MALHIRAHISRIIHRFGRHSSYWQFGRRLERARFRIQKLRFDIRRFGAERLSSIRFGWDVTRVIVPQTLYAGLLCLIAWASDLFLVPHLVLRSGIPLRELDSGTYVSIASTVAATLGAFLGLYFTAIGVVVGGVYSRVPSDVRELAVREQVGVRYLKWIALTCVYAIYLAALQGAHFFTSRSGFVLLLILTTYSVFAFVELGLRVYRLLDPELLAQRLNREVLAGLEHLRFGQPYAGSPSFQEHYRKRISDALHTYETLFAVAQTAEPPNLDASKKLLHGVAFLWSVYEHQRSKIPTGSRWYVPRPEFQSLLASDSSTNITIHLATATMPQPREAKDYLWFEGTIGRTIAKNTIAQIEAGDLNGALEILNVLQQRTAATAKEFAIDEAIAVEGELSEALLRELPRIEERTANSQGASAEADIGAVTQMSDFVALAPMQTLLGLVQRLDEFAPQKLGEIADWQQWFARGRYYAERLPREVCLELDDVRTRLRFERDVEDRVLTPDWFLREMYACSLVAAVQRLFVAAADRLLAVYAPAIEQIKDVSSGIPAMHVALRGLEACHKVLHHARGVASWCDAMGSLHILRTDIPSRFESAELEARVDRLRSLLYDHVAHLAFRVFDEGAKRQRRLPDYFGQAYMMVAQETFDRIRRGVEGTGELYRAFAGLSLLAMQRLRSELSDVENVTTQVTYLTEPLLNLIELGGHGFLYGQLHGRGSTWRAICSIWDELLRDKAFTASAVRLLFDDSFVVMRPFFALRFNWQKALREDVKNRVADEGWLSPFVAAVAEDATSWHHFDLQTKDVFLLVYLRYRTEFADIKLSHGAESLQHALDRVNYETSETE